MLITSLTILFFLAAVIKPLRHWFYLIHIILIAATCWLYESKFGHTELFSNKALSIFLQFHLILINLITLALYFYDKNAAINQKWRIPEKTMHAFALVGGTPGAFVAQKILRHKTRKQSFKVLFWIIFIFQLVALFFLWNKI